MWKREMTQLAQALRTIVSLCVLFSSPQTGTYLHCKPAWSGISSGGFYLSHELVITKSHFLITNVRKKQEDDQHMCSCLKLYHLKGLC